MLVLGWNPSKVELIWFHILQAEGNQDRYILNNWPAKCLSFSNQSPELRLGDKMNIYLDYVLMIIWIWALKQSNSATDYI